jgi:hypothetical protein
MEFDKKRAFKFLTKLSEKIPNKYHLTIVQNIKAKKNIF